MNKLGIGIVGSGYMGRTHAEAARRLPMVQPVAVWGGRRAARLATDYGLACEASLERLVNRADIDAIIITTPHHRHATDALLALNARKHVLVEKPMATTVVDCDRMIAAATKNGVVLSTGYQQRFRINNRKARALIREGAIGDVLTLQISMPIAASQQRKGGFGGNWEWWDDPASRGHLFNSAPHALDLARWFTGSEVSNVAALARTLLPGVLLEDTTMALLEFSRGAICTFFSSRALPAQSFPGEDFRIRIIGRHGLLDLDPYGELRLSDANGWSLVSRQPTVPHTQADAAFGDVRMQAYCDQLSSFADAIYGQAAAEVGSALDGRAGVAACAAMLESSEQKGWVSLSP